jgi:hypothetical protein
MTPIIEVVWRHLLVQSAVGRRRYDGLADLATELDLGVSTIHAALRHPVEIGAVDISRRAGVRVLDPARVLTLYAAHRHVRRDVIDERMVDLPAENVERELAAQFGVILGGFRALVDHAGGVNRVADYSTVLLYGTPDLNGLAPATSNVATKVLVLEADRWLANYGSITPAAQAYADLFSLPGWQAQRFLEATNVQDITSNERILLHN